MNQNTKNKKYWLRGGIIGMTFFIILYILSQNVSGGAWNINIFEWIFILISFPVFLLEDKIGEYNTFLLGRIYFFIIGFFLGAVIGWLYGKMKSKIDIYNY